MHTVQHITSSTAEYGFTNSRYSKLRAGVCLADFPEKSDEAFLFILFISLFPNVSKNLR
jgi:hypothetical protein